jgi:hypothetical protein
VSGRRRPRRRTTNNAATPLPPFTFAIDNHEDWNGVEYVVRALRGSSSTKAYRCPGCEQEILPGTPHQVVWPADDAEATDRRHWHSSCWAARHRRAPRQRRH